MSREDVPRCVACGSNLTVEHILTECGDFAKIRQKYYDAETSVTFLFDFSHEIGLLSRI